MRLSNPASHRARYLRPVTVSRSRRRSNNLAAGAAAHFWKERIFAGFATDIEIRAICIGKARRLQLLPDATAIVVQRRQVTEGGLVVQKYRQRLSAPLEAAIELGVGLRQKPGVQIRA